MLRRPAARATRSPRLLLVELAPDQIERRFRVEWFPLILGLAAKRGWAASWCVLGVRYDATLRYSVSRDDFRTLCAEARRRQPSVVVVNERLAPPQERALAAAAGKARVVSCRSGEVVWGLAAFLRDELALPVSLGDAEILRTIEPRFVREVLNLPRAAWATRPLVRVPAGPRCSYRRPANANRLYRDLPVPASFGCSFCGFGSADVPPPAVEDPIAFAARYVAAACRDGKTCREKPRFELVGTPLWAGLEALVGALLRRGVRSAELNFMPRVDELLASRATIERCLPRLARAGIALRLFGMGVENFSLLENERLNKGISAEQVHAAADWLVATSARWPEQLQAGAFSMILFTPWTTVEDLRINVDHMRRCPLLPGPFALGQRLQLFPGRAVTALAEKDGLLAARRLSGAAFYNSGCITKFDQRELPWRFQHPEAGLLFRFGAAIAALHGGAEAAEPGIEPLAAARRASPDRERDPMPLFAEAVDQVAKDPGIGTMAVLVARVLQATGGGDRS